MSSLNDSQRRFFNLLDHYPRLASIWNREEREYDPDEAARTLEVCSPGEAVTLKSLLTIWRGNAGKKGEFEIDLAGLAIIDPANCRPLLGWLANPFWP